MGGFAAVRNMVKQNMDFAVRDHRQGDLHAVCA
jgi:hypothetical protein